MAKAESKLKRLKQKAKAGVEKIERAEKERDEAKQEAKVAHLSAVVADEAKAKAKAEDDLTKARDAFAAA